VYKAKDLVTGKLVALKKTRLEVWNIELKNPQNVDMTTKFHADGRGGSSVNDSQRGVAFTDA
jgi:hypothetical protein